LTPHIDDEDVMRRFLLGRSSPEEREAIEERFLIDADYFDALCALESEMGLDHLSHRLPARERQAFERAVLAVPSRARHVQELESFTAALEAQRPSSPRVQHRTWLRVAIDFLGARAPRLAVMASAAAVVLAAAVFLQSPSPGPQSDDPATEPTAVAPAAPPALVVESWQLTPGITRAQLRQANVFRRPVGAAQIELATVIPDAPVARIRATLSHVDDGPLALLSEPDVTAVPDGIAVRVRVSATLLIRGDYVLSLSRLADDSAPEPFATRLFTVDEN
jgi:hypothetical protein